MSARPVHDFDAKNPKLAAEMRLHAWERNEICDRLQAELAADARVEKAWLWGSFMRGEADDLSDLDLWLTVPDEHAEGMAYDLRALCSRSGRMLYAAPNAHNAPPQGGYMSVFFEGSHGIHHLDLYWQANSIAEVPDTAFLVDKPSGAHAVQTRLLEELSPNELKLGFVWQMLSIAAKYLARDPDSDMSLVQYPKPSFYEVAAALGLKPSVSWDAPSHPLEKVGLLRSLANATGELELALIQGHDQRVRRCLASYLDLVELILKDRL
jgi:hypothetical protein